MTTRKPTPPPPPPRPNQVVQAKPIAPPDKKQVDLETIAYELREIRIFLGKAAKAKQRGGVLLIIAGVIIFGLGVLEAALPPGQQQTGQVVTSGVLLMVGTVLMVVGGSLQYDPNLEKSS